MDLLVLVGEIDAERSGEGMFRLRGVVSGEVGDKA